MIEVEADAATSDRISRHAPEARGLVRRGGTEGRREGRREEGMKVGSSFSAERERARREIKGGRKVEMSERKG